MTNFEFKARLQNADKINEVLKKRKARYAGVMRQVDTYFRVERGRLKLREITYEKEETPPVKSRSQLIFYTRPDLASVKQSEYQIAPVADAASLRDLLRSALGIVVEVKKRRELNLLKYADQEKIDSKTNIRVHLDKVDQLGEFIEVEAVVGNEISFEQASTEAQSLLAEFELRPQDLISHSYADLILKNR